MMLEYRDGDLWDVALEEGVNGIVVPVNCVGVTGAGMAKQWRLRMRDKSLVRIYERCCARGELLPGEIMCFFGMGALCPETYCPAYFLWATKDHWRFPSRLEWVRKGAATLAELLREGAGGVQSVAVPQVGCGLGGLEWAQVLPVLREHLETSPARVLIVTHAD
jgi:hypothetical protein